MGEHAKEALRLHEEYGCNCASCIFAAYGDLTGLDFETASRIASSFGGGMGRLEQACGAFSGILLVYGLLHGPTGGEGKQEHYAVVRDMAAEFTARCGALTCPDLLGPVLYTPANAEILAQRKQRCSAIIAAACDLLDERLKQK